MISFWERELESSNRDDFELESSSVMLNGIFGAKLALKGYGAYFLIYSKKKHQHYKQSQPQSNQQNKQRIHHFFEDS